MRRDAPGGLAWTGGPGPRPSRLTPRAVRAGPAGWTVRVGPRGRVGGQGRAERPDHRTGPSAATGPYGHVRTTPPDRTAGPARPDRRGSAGWGRRARPRSRRRANCRTVRAAQAGALQEPGLRPDRTARRTAHGARRTAEPADRTERHGRPGGADRTARPNGRAQPNGTAEPADRTERHDRTCGPHRATPPTRRTRPDGSAEPADQAGRPRRTRGHGRAAWADRVAGLGRSDGPGRVTSAGLAGRGALGAAMWGRWGCG